MRHPTKSGFTLTELLVVVTILAILIMIALSMVTRNLDKATDSRVKSQLNRLKIAFEDYYADHNCYPPPEFFDDSSDCNSSQLAPYLSAIPCDKITGTPYILETDETGCGWFKLYTDLRAASSDEEALALCDPDGSLLGNYAISSDNVTPTVYCDLLTSPSPSSTPTPTTTPNPSGLPDNGTDYYYCSDIGNCTDFDHTQYTCTPFYANNPNCDGGINKCSSLGTCQEL